MPLGLFVRIIKYFHQQMRLREAPGAQTVAKIDSCPYSALRMYVNSPLMNGLQGIFAESSTDEHLNAVKNGPYGICVWHAGNDVVDHQVVMMEFEGGATATCTLTGYSASNGRRISYREPTVRCYMTKLPELSQKKFRGN